METTAAPGRELSLRDAVFAAGGRNLLGPVTLGFPTGRVHGVIGPNGSGKSTLLGLLSRQLAPTAGAVSLGGRPAASFGARAFARAVAHLPQALPVRTGLTVRELVALGRYPWHGALGRIGTADRAAVAAAMAATDLAALAERPADVLSGGERQRAWVAMLVAQGAGALLLDEPTAALDLAHAVEVLDLLGRLARGGPAAIVVVLHDVNLAARYCDRLVALKNGRVYFDGAPEALMRRDVLGGLYGLPMAVIRREGASVCVPA